MRLTEYEQHIIVQAIHTYFPNDKDIYLFGSRVDDTATGGDIDVFVDLKSQDHQSVLHRCQSVSAIQMALGDQKIDLIVRQPDSSPQAIYQEALQYGKSLML